MKKAITAALIGGALIGLGLTACAPLPTNGAMATRAATAPASATIAPAGSAVRDGKFEFRVLRVERAKTVNDPTGNPYMTTTAQGEFVVITMSVANIGDQPQNYFGDNQKVIDATGREYGAKTEANMWMNTSTSPLGAINPGNSIRVKAAFDVPPGTQPTVLELHDSMFSGGVSVRLA
ncbi:MAG TPA: DUF4352 domain-containing protein [Mycobacterium sp.]|nr:DUF4352 domain-containing protein [Mycobacterium sp.]